MRSITQAIVCALSATLLITAVGCKSNDAETKATQPKPGDKASETPPAKPDAKPAAKPAPKGESVDAYIKKLDTDLIAVHLEPTGITLDTKQLVAFNEAVEVDPKLKRGGPLSLYVTPVFEALQKKAAAQPLPEGENLRILAAFHEPSVPYRRLLELSYTAGLALKPNHAGMKLMVRRPDGAWDGFNASKPQLEVGPDMGDAEELAAKQLHLHIGSKGVKLAINGAAVPPIDGCPKEGPTVCNKGGADASALLKKAAEAQGPAQVKALQEVIDAYDRRALYNTLVDLKKANPDETITHVIAINSTPMALVGSVMGTIRQVRPGGDAKGHFQDDAAFGKLDATPHPPALPVETKELFPDIILGLE